MKKVMFKRIDNIEIAVFETRPATSKWSKVFFLKCFRLGKEDKIEEKGHKMLTDSQAIKKFVDIVKALESGNLKLNI